MTAKQYAKAVLNGKIVACKWVKLACQRFLNDFNNPDLYYDDDAVNRVINFFTLLPHVKGEWAGQSLKLEGWEQFIIANLFGWKQKKDRLRRFKTGYIEVARKNGKSSILAGVGLYLMRFDDEAGAEVYSAATTRDQAKLVFDIAKDMVNKSKLKGKYITSFKNNLHDITTASKFEPLSSDYNSLDGLNIHGVIIDELHAHKTRELYDVLLTGIGARRQPMIVTITTAGFDKESICWEQHAHTERILEGVIKEDSHFGVIYTIDTEDKEKWDDESIWIKANPNLNISVKLDDLQMKKERAKQMPTELNNFMRKHLNIWTESVTRWITDELWQSASSSYSEADLLGQDCYAGLDLSTSLDITALCYVFPDSPMKILCRFFIPEENMRERVHRDRVPYDLWANDGWIELTDGNVIDYAYVLNRLSMDMQKFNVRDLCFDRWGATKIIQDLQNMGFEEENEKHWQQRKIIQFGQGFASMSAPTKEFEKMLRSKEIVHDGNPVLRWMASNTVVKVDPAGNIKPDKGKSTERIDGVVATIMALDRAVRHKQAEVAISFI